MDASLVINGGSRIKNAQWRHYLYLFIYELRKMHIHISKYEDEIAWIFNKSCGLFSKNIGYQEMMNEEENGMLWWYQKLWKTQ